MGSENEKMFIENDYIEWLSKFILEHRDFNTDDIHSLFKDLKNEDKANISKLGYFYNMINEYTDSNNINPNFYLLGNYFKLKYNNQKFFVGKSLVYDEVNYFCKKGYPFGKYIDFYDIQNYFIEDEKQKSR